jgi:hypothetical protein
MTLAGPGRRRQLPGLLLLLPLLLLLLCCGIWVP